MSILAKTIHPWSRMRWSQSFWRRTGLATGIIGANLLYASFACAQNTLDHIDPVVFCALQMVLFLPGALICFYRSRKRVSHSQMRSSAVAGLLLGLGFLGVALTLRNMGIIRTAMLTCLDGVMASIVARYVLQQRQSTAVLMAAICAASGALLLWFISPGAWQADILALLVGLLFCLYSLHVERIGVLVETARGELGPFFGIVFSTMAAIDLMAALCFGRWDTMQTFTLPDFGVLIYTSGFTILVPIVLNTLLQRYITAVHLSFAAVIEPLASIGFAYQQRALHLALLGWFGIVCIVCSLLILATGSRSRPEGAL